jgi:predicted permease
VIVRIQAKARSGFLDSVFQDVRFGARILARSPGISLAVILALALGIGANSAIFSLVDAFILHSVRYTDPASLAILWDKNPEGGLRSASAANFLDWRKQSKSFTQIAGWAPAPFVLTGLERPQQITGAFVTANFFRTLGVMPRLGRTFLPDEDGLDNPANAARTAVISYGMWTGLLASDPNVLGRNIQLDNTTYAIVGVMPEDFTFRIRRHQVWVPVSLDRNNRDYHYLTVVGRLNTSRAAASAEMKMVGENLARAYPKTNRGRSIQVDDLQEWLIANHTFKTRLLILFSAVGLVLLIACTNVASLLLARSSARNREVALRLALGATRSRLARQLLTESVLLALAGGALGLVFAWFLIGAAPAILPPDLIPPGVTVGLSQLVVLFTAGVSLLTGVLFGMAPALAATRPEVQETLQDSSRGSTGGRGGQRFRQVMVVVEVALALMMLAGATLMTESLRRMTSVDLGFEPKDVLMLRLSLPAARYNAANSWRLQEQLLLRLARLPGVAGVAAASNLPLARPTIRVPFDLPDAPPRALADRPAVTYVSISADYVKTLGIRLVRGRNFAATDNENSPPVAIVNQAFVSRHFPGQDPLGKRIILNRPQLGKNEFAGDIPVEIVGIIGNVKLGDLGAPPEAMLYAPQPQNVWSTNTWLAVRTNMEPVNLTAAIRREMAELDKDQPVDEVGSMQRSFDAQFLQPRFQSQVMLALAGLALVLAVVGIYGINAYTVARQRRDIGVRIALGASPGSVVLRTVVRGMLLTAVGVVLGLVAALFLAPVARSVLVGIGPADPLVLAGVTVFLMGVSGLACYLPAHRAARIDPASALRQE